MAKFNVRKVLENATDDQKDLLLELVTDYTNAVDGLQEIEKAQKSERRVKQKTIETLLATILETIEEMETGQKSLFEPSETSDEGPGTDEFDH